MKQDTFLSSDAICTRQWFRRFPWCTALILVTGCQPGAIDTTRNPAAPQDVAIVASQPEVPSNSQSESVHTTLYDDDGALAADVALHPTLKDRRYDAPIRDVVDREDPTVDGWDSERFNELASKQLKTVGQSIQTGRVTAEAAKLCTEDFTASSLRPTKSLKAVFEGPLFLVRRPTTVDTSRRDFSGVDGFASAIKELASAFPTDAESHFKFKIIRVTLSSDLAQTKAYFQMTARAADGRSTQVSATWDCEWTIDRTYPRLQSIVVSDYEEVVSRPRSHPTVYSDCTESQFAGNAVFAEQLIHGRDHWYGSLESTIGVEGRGNGIAIGDANGDGLEDIYFCQPAALPNRLFIRDRDGRFLDRSVAAGVDWLDSSRGALFVDLDNDGDQDLVVAESTSLILHENDGSGKFQVRGRLTTASRLFSLNAVDFDNDGNLDLFACGYSGVGQIRPEDIFASPVPYHDANNGAPNLLWRSEGNWTFRDVTTEVGLNQNNLRFSLASVWDDFDNDGDLDLYVANDFGRNNLYRNDESVKGGLRWFVDIAGAAAVEDIGPGMSAACGDVDNDGLIDIYVSNMFSSAGNRITHQRQFKPGAAADDIEGFQRHARGNSLFINQGDGTFADRAFESGTFLGRWAWGSQFADLNNDGWRDIYVANGFVTADNNNDL